MSPPPSVRECFSSGFVDIDDEQVAAADEGDVLAVRARSVTNSFAAAGLGEPDRGPAVEVRERRGPGRCRTGTPVRSGFMRKNVRLRRACRRSFGVEVLQRRERLLELLRVDERLGLAGAGVDLPELALLHLQEVLAVEPRAGA